MAVSITHTLLVAIFLVSLNRVSGQLEITVVGVEDTLTVDGVQDIITLLESITDTSITTSMFLPHLESLLKNQQLLTNNLLLQNLTDTCSVDEVASILHDIMEYQNDHFNQSISTQIRMEDLLDRMANTQTQMASFLNESVDTQNRMEDSLGQIANTQTQMASALNESVDTQTRMEDNLGQIVNTQTHMASALDKIVDTQNRMEATLDQMANTQTQMANALTQSVNIQNRTEATLDQMANTSTQVVNILQMQSEQLQNITSTMTYMAGQLDTQNQFISHPPIDIPRDCTDLVLRGPFSSKSYIIRSWDNLGNFRAYCDMEEGDWTVIQRRFDGLVDFYRGWDDYENGFGSPDGEHWLGLRQIYRLTHQGFWTLRIDLEDFQGNTAYAVYQYFSVGDAQSYYRLSIGAYSGTAGDSLTQLGHNQAFTTKDNDNDNDGLPLNCAVDRQGAWWYKGCNFSNLNGLYLGPSQDTNTGMTWHHWKGNREVLKKSVMKIQRIN